MAELYSVPKLEDYSSASMDSAVRELLAALDQEAAKLSGENEWKVFRDRWMSRKSGVLMQVTEWLKTAPKEQKRDVGQRVNEVKVKIEAAVDAAEARVQSSAASSRLLTERIDITLPGNRRPLGVKHPVLRVMDEIVAVFKAMGYSIGEGPEVETDYYNFESLNFPPNHPARDTQDTLFIAGQEKKAQRDRLLMRTHTSPVQIRTMEKVKPPVRIVIPGKVHRNDALDATHSPVFHQVEGLVRRYEYHLQRPEGHAGSRLQKPVRRKREDSLLSVILPVH